MSGVVAGSGGRITQRIAGITTISSGTATGNTTIAAVVLLLTQLRFLGVLAVSALTPANMARLQLTNTTTVNATTTTNTSADLVVGWELTEYSQ